MSPLKLLLFMVVALGQEQCKTLTDCATCAADAECLFCPGLNLCLPQNTDVCEADKVTDVGNCPTCFSLGVTGHCSVPLSTLLEDRDRCLAVHTSDNALFENPSPCEQAFEAELPCREALVALSCSWQCAECGQSIDPICQSACDPILQEHCPKTLAACEGERTWPFQHVCTRSSKCRSEVLPVKDLIVPTRAPPTPATPPPSPRPTPAETLPSVAERTFRTVDGTTTTGGPETTAYTGEPRNIDDLDPAVLDAQRDEVRRRNQVMLDRLPLVAGVTMGLVLLTCAVCVYGNRRKQGPRGE